MTVIALISIFTPTLHTHPPHLDSKRMSIMLDRRASMSLTRPKSFSDGPIKRQVAKRDSRDSRDSILNEDSLVCVCACVRACVR